MSWRTIVISERSKLDFKMNYMVVRDTETTRFFIDEIAVLVIESQNVSMTAYLVSDLTGGQPVYEMLLKRSLRLRDRARARFEAGRKRPARREPHV